MNQQKSRERDTEFQIDHNGIIFKDGPNAKSKILVPRKTQKKFFQEIGHQWLVSIKYRSKYLLNDMEIGQF